MKRLLAFILTGTLSLSNVGWAGGFAQEKERSIEQEILFFRATDSNAVWNATDSNASLYDETYSNAATLAGTEKFSYMKITFNSQVLRKVYNDGEDPKIQRIEASDFVAVADGEEIEGIDLTNVSFTREEGEAPGSYVVKTLKADQCDQIEIEQNEFSSFVIEKGKADIHMKEIYLPMDDSKKTVNLLDLVTFQGKQDLTMVTVKELSEESKKYFSSFPKAAGDTSICFTLKPSDESVKIEIPVETEGTYYTYGEDKLVLYVSPRTYVERRTEKEIKEYFAENPFRETEEDTWDIEPDGKAEIAGELSETSVKNALNALNFIRYVAGINLVANSTEYEEYAQAGTVLLDQTKTLEHFPEKPEGMSEEFYQKGYAGTSNSNLSWGAVNMATHVMGWMEELEENMDSLAHRRWILDSRIAKTGFGRTGSCCAMYIRDRSAEETNYDFIPWPAQTMPIEYFYGPWSVILNPKWYADSMEKYAEEIKVTMTDMGTGKTYVLDSSCNDKSGKYFHVSSSGFGNGPAVIFCPDVRFQEGDEVNIEITGLRDSYGNQTTVEYTATFFSMIDKVFVGSIQLDMESAAIDEGDSFSLTATILPEDAADAEESKITWSSSNPEVALVDSQGKVTGISEGTATIMAELNGKTASCVVTVKQAIPLERIELNASSQTLNVGKTWKLSVSMVPENATNVKLEDVKWTSWGEIVSVGEDGTVTARKPGSTTIRAFLGGMQAECTIKVVEIPVMEIELLADGLEKRVNLSEVNSYNWIFRETGIPKSFTGKEIPDAAKEYFSVLPEAEGQTVRMQFKESKEAFQVDIPFCLVGDGYTEYNNDFVLRVSGKPTAFVASRTQDEIRDYFKSHSFSQSDNDTWDVKPNASKEEAGKLSDQSVENALNTLNFIRYIAGIPSNLTNNKEYESYAQAGTTLLVRAGQGLTHFPDKPSGISDEFYEKGYKGTSSSNLAMGYRNLSDALINGWMEDGDSSNIDRVGHRRWCLDPSMRQTGFGHSGSYTAMYCFDSSSTEGAEADYQYIPWPAQTMPFDYFQGPWSVSLNPDIYNKIEDVKVTVTSKKTGKVYTLDESSKNQSGKYLNVDNGRYGFGPAVIFSPGVKFSAGDQVSVAITGLKDPYGNEIPVEYTVSFFSMSVKKLQSLKLNLTSRTMLIDSTYQLKVSTVPSNADVSLDDVEWYSSDEEVAYVDDDGEVTAIAQGTARITAELDGKKATCTITVRKSGSSGSSGGSGGGSSSGSSGSSGSGSKKGSASSGGPTASTIGSPAEALPSYVVLGNWSLSNGQWKFADLMGQEYKDKWAAVHNPYANAALGQSSFDWFRFDTAGNMVTGWFRDIDGNLYYLNPASDGTRGKMMTGWAWIADAFGVQRCYYFNPNSDGYRGRMVTNTVINGFTINEEGLWTVNGIVQTK